MRNRFEHRTAIVTGAARGIGKQVAVDLAAEGARVTISDLDEPVLAEVANEIRNDGGTCLVVKCDVAARAETDRMIELTHAEFGTVDILINNAGLLLTGTIEETSDEIIDDTLAVNVKGVLYAIRRAAPIMKSQKYGKIINVASITGKNGDNSTVFAYGASKGAVMSLTRSVARQLAPYNINVNAVAPHAVLTTMMGYWTEAKQRDAIAKIPMGRLGTPQDISALILFLASDESSFITGEVVNINGGFYMD